MKINECEALQEIKFAALQGDETSSEIKVMKVKTKKLMIPGQSHKEMFYVGILLNEEKKPYHLFIDKKNRGCMSWDDAVKCGDLPSSDEMFLIHANRDLLDLSPYYWSSTENSAASAWGFLFYYGFYQHLSSKTNAYYVRCVRRLMI